jgi:inhibitor of cysteine peptidase
MKHLLLLAVFTALLAVPALQPKDRVAAPFKKGKNSIQLTDADNKKTVKLPFGASFDIALKGNATTGYQWQIGKIEGDAVQQTGNVDYIPDKHLEQMVGFGGTFVFHFTIAKAARARIRLVYIRSWERDKPPEKTFEVTIAPFHNS